MIEAIEITGFTDAQTARITSALARASRRVQLPQFEKACRALTDQPTETTDTWDQILAKICGEVKVSIRSYRTWWPYSKVLGYEGDGVLYINLWRLDNESDVVLESNLVHEAAHACGYTHRWNPYRWSYKTAPHRCSDAYCDAFEEAK